MSPDQIPDGQSVTSRRIAAALREEILAGAIAPGTWLRQDDVAARLGASRLPVREAMRILETENLVETLPNRGARVPVLALDDVNVYYRMRERLEPLALSLALAHISEATIDEIEEAQQEIESLDSTRTLEVERFLDLDRRFHVTAYETCPNEHLRTTTLGLWNATQHFRRVFMTLAGVERLPIVNAEHRLILDAIRRRDSLDAERYLAGHIRRTRIALNENPQLFA